MQDDDDSTSSRATTARGSLETTPPLQGSEEASTMLAGVNSFTERVGQKRCRCDDDIPFNSSNKDLSKKLKINDGSNDANSSTPQSLLLPTEAEGQVMERTSPPGENEETQIFCTELNDSSGNHHKSSSTLEKEATGHEKTMETSLLRTSGESNTTVSQQKEQDTKEENCTEKKMATGGAHGEECTRSSCNGHEQQDDNASQSEASSSEGSATTTSSTQTDQRSLRRRAKEFDKLLLAQQNVLTDFDVAQKQRRDTEDDGLQSELKDLAGSEILLHHELKLVDSSFGQLNDHDDSLPRNVPESENLVGQPKGEGLLPDLDDEEWETAMARLGGAEENEKEHGRAPKELNPPDVSIERPKEAKDVTVDAKEPVITKKENEESVLGDDDASVASFANKECAELAPQYLDDTTALFSLVESSRKRKRGHSVDTPCHHKHIRNREGDSAGNDVPNDSSDSSNDTDSTNKGESVDDGDDARDASTNIDSLNQVKTESDQPPVEGSFKHAKDDHGAVVPVASKEGITESDLFVSASAGEEEDKDTEEDRGEVPGEIVQVDANEAQPACHAKSEPDVQTTVSVTRCSEKNDTDKEDKETNKVKTLNEE